MFSSRSRSARTRAKPSEPASCRGSSRRPSSSWCRVAAGTEGEATTRGRDVDVVDDHDHRHVRSREPTQPDHRIKQAKAGRVRGNLHVHSRRVTEGERRHDLGKVVGIGAELGAKSRDAETVDRCSERLHPWPVRRCATGLPTSPPRDLRSCRSRPRSQLRRQARLPDPRLASDEEQPTPPRPRPRGRPRAQRSQLPPRRVGTHAESGSAGQRTEVQGAARMASVAGVAGKASAVHGGVDLPGRRPPGDAAIRADDPSAFSSSIPRLGAPEGRGARRWRPSRARGEEHRQV